MLEPKMREPFSRVYWGSPATYFLSPPVMSKNFTWISLSFSGDLKNAMYSMFHLPVSPFSSVGQILSVLAFCSAAVKAPGDEKRIGIRFFVITILPAKASSGFAAALG